MDTQTITKEKILSILAGVTDPEVPVLSIIDLGIVRDIETDISGKTKITITPTYTGCPALDVINRNMKTALTENGITNFEIRNTLSPAWTTDWMSAAAKQKLRDYGIAPPNIKQQVCLQEAFQKEEAVQCPHCNSYNTRLISRFGSTACKAFYTCNDCKEPFDYFKCH